MADSDVVSIALQCHPVAEPEKLSFIQHFTCQEYQDGGKFSTGALGWYCGGAAGRGMGVMFLALKYAVTWPGTSARTSFAKAAGGACIEKSNCALWLQLVGGGSAIPSGCD